MVEATKYNKTILSGLTNTILAGQSILDVFVLQDILDLEDAENLKHHFRTNREIENFLVKNRLVTRETINKAYSILLKLPYVSLESVRISDEALAIIPEKLARKFGIIPFNLSEGLVRIAISRPADLLARYPDGLAQYFEKRNLGIELFITGESDFLEAVKQYEPKGRRSVLVNKGSLPVVFLRNQIIPQKYLKRLPIEFIQRYRLVVFGENRANEFLVACESPDSPLTRKIIEFLVKENKIKTELFATSKEDIDYVLNSYNQGFGPRPKLDLGFKDKEKAKNNQKDGSGGQGRIDLKKFFGSFMSSDNCLVTLTLC